MNEYRKDNLALMPRYHWRLIYLFGALRSFLSPDPFLTLCESCKWRKAAKEFESVGIKKTKVYLCKHCHNFFKSNGTTN